MSNKFLSIYPQLWEPKIGDRIKIIRSNYSTIWHTSRYYAGKTGIIDIVANEPPEYLIEIDNENRYVWVNKEDVKVIRN